MHKNPLVSIIVPAFNVENYIQKCIDSLVKQTYTNIEIIVIDDSSTDSTNKILKKNVSNKLHVLRHHKNKGQAAGRNLGLEKSKGEIILFVDADDYIERDTIEEVVSSFQRYDINMIRFNAISYDDKKDKLYQEKRYNFSKYLREDYIYKNNSLKDIYLSYNASPVLYACKKSILIDKNIKFTEGIIHEDELFNTNLYLNIDSVLFINRSFYIRRYRDNSTMTNKSKEQLKYSFNSYLFILNEYKILLNNLEDNKKKLFIKYRINSIIYNLQRFSISNIYKNDKLERVNEKKLYYKKLYKYLIRFRKLILIFKNKIIKELICTII